MGGRGSSSASAVSAASYAEVVQQNPNIQPLEGWNPVTGDGDPYVVGYESEADFERAVRNQWSFSSEAFRHPYSDDTRKNARAFDNAIEAGGGYQGGLSRGVALDDATMAEIKPGALIDQKGTASWSKHPKIAESFAYNNADWGDGSPVVFIMSSGTKHGRDISNLNPRKSEAEVVTSSRSQQRVLRVEKPKKRGGITKVYVEEV